MKHLSSRRWKGSLKWRWNLGGTKFKSNFVRCWRKCKRMVWRYLRDDQNLKWIVDWSFISRCTYKWSQTTTIEKLLSSIWFYIRTYKDHVYYLKICALSPMLMLHAQLCRRLIRTLSWIKYGLSLYTKKKHPYLFYIVQHIILKMHIPFESCLDFRFLH